MNHSDLQSSLKESIASPQIESLTEWEDPQLSYLTLKALWEFERLYERTPHPQSSEDAEEVVRLVQSFSEKEVPKDF